MRLGVEGVVVGSFNEIERLAEIGKRMCRTFKVLLKITPGILPQYTTLFYRSR